MKKWTELEDKLVLDLIPEDGVFTRELALTLKRQLPGRSTKSIESYWYRKLRKGWLENKVKEAETAALATKPNFWQKLINLFKSK